MTLEDDIGGRHARWRRLDGYRKFEHLVVLLLSGLIAVIVASALWSLAEKILANLIMSGTFNPADHAVFQEVFGMVFTVIYLYRISSLILAKFGNAAVVAGPSILSFWTIAGEGPSR